MTNTLCSKKHQSIAIGPSRLLIILTFVLFSSSGYLYAQCGPTCDDTKNNTFTGIDAGIANSLGVDNSFYGEAAGKLNTDGVANSFFGVAAGLSNTTGDSLSFFGRDAGRANDSGDYNSFFGNNAGKSNTSGSNNSFFGGNAGKFNLTGDYNSFFGWAAGINTIAGSNSFFGTAAGLGNITGKDNCFFGLGAGSTNRSGSYNSFFGIVTGRYAKGSGNVFLGYGAGPTFENDDINLRLYIDADTSNTDGNDAPLIYGEFDNDFVRINGTFEVTAGLSNPSSRKLKHQFVAINASSILAKLSTLDVSQWSYKHRPNEKHFGPVAEEFYELFGLGEGDTKISTIDADGVMMLAIQALKDENEMLKSELAKQAELMEEIMRRLK